MEIDVPLETISEASGLDRDIDEQLTNKILKIKDFFIFIIFVFFLFLIFDMRLQNYDHSQSNNPIFVDIKYPLSIYVVSHKQVILSPDLRGRFWENQINFNSHQMITIDHLSNRKFTVNDVEFSGDENFFTFDYDSKLCTKAKLVFESFLKDHPNSGWLMRATHDSYIIINNLLKVIKELEEKYDPFNDIALAYELYTNKNKTFPHGSIILFSRKFVEEIMKDIDNYEILCQTTADDVAFGLWMKNKNIDLEKFRNKRFQINWPNTYENMPRIVYYKFAPLFSEKCPKYWSMPGMKEKEPKLASELAAIHFHSVNMLLCQNIVKYIENNERLGIYHDRNGESKFCFF